MFQTTTIEHLDNIDVIVPPALWDNVLGARSRCRTMLLLEVDYPVAGL